MDQATLTLAEGLRDDLCRPYAQPAASLATTGRLALLRLSGAVSWHLDPVPAGADPVELLAHAVRIWSPAGGGTAGHGDDRHRRAVPDRRGGQSGHQSRSRERAQPSVPAPLDAEPALLFPARRLRRLQRLLGNDPEPLLLGQNRAWRP